MKPLHGKVISICLCFKNWETRQSQMKLLSLTGKLTPKAFASFGLGGWFYIPGARYEMV